MLVTAYFLVPERKLRLVALAFSPIAVFLAWTGTPFTPQPANLQETWSPYYRISYYPDSKAISVNLIGQQSMVSRQAFSPAYSLPHLLNRDSGKPPFSEVLVIGAGSGNDVSCPRLRRRPCRRGGNRSGDLRPGPHHPDSPYPTRAS
jgi:hypothetical protein